MRYFSIILLASLFICNINAQTDSIRSFIFGHSLIDHRPPLIPTPSNETTVPHWVYLIAQEAGKGYAAGGKYGFLPQHANLPPFSQWGYDIVPPVWESDTEPFSDADINNVMITAGNFMQWQPPHFPYFGADSIWTPITATQAVIDWVTMQEDEMNVYIYENWPDMAPYLSNGFPPSASDFENYNNYTVGEFHDWWIDYHDSLLLSDPETNVRMIPVGPILAGLLTDTPLNQIELTELYEDDAPHGRANIYFLAGLITYMSVYAEAAPISFTVPAIIDPIIANNYALVVNYIWTELQNFNNENNVSRVFYPDVISTNVDFILKENAITLYPNPTAGILQIEGDVSLYDVEILDANGVVYQTLNSNSSISIDISSLPVGLYFIRMKSIPDGEVFFQKIIKN